MVEEGVLDCFGLKRDVDRWEGLWVVWAKIIAPVCMYLSGEMHVIVYYSTGTVTFSRLRIVGAGYGNLCDSCDVA